MKRACIGSAARLEATLTRRRRATPTESSRVDDLDYYIDLRKWNVVSLKFNRQVGLNINSLFNRL